MRRRMLAMMTILRDPARRALLVAANRTNYQMMMMRTRMMNLSRKMAPVMKVKKVVRTRMMTMMMPRRARMKMRTWMTA